MQEFTKMEICHISDNEIDNKYIENPNSINKVNREKEIIQHHKTISDLFYESTINKINYYLKKLDDNLLDANSFLKKQKERLIDLDSTIIEGYEYLPWGSAVTMRIGILFISILLIVVISTYTIGGIILDNDIPFFNENRYFAYSIGIFSLMLGILIENIHFRQKNSAIKSLIQKLVNIFAILFFIIWAITNVKEFGQDISGTESLNIWDEDGILNNINFSYILMLSQFFTETFITSSFAIMIENIITSRKQIIEVPNKYYIGIKKNINDIKNEIQKNEELIYKYNSYLKEIYFFKKIFINNVVEIYRDKNKGD